MDPQEARAYLWGRRFVDRLRTTLAGLSAAHFNSCCKSADLKTAADRYVVTRSNVSIEAIGGAGLDRPPFPPQPQPLGGGVTVSSAPAWSRS
jgi:hypothetical protein